MKGAFRKKILAGFATTLIMVGGFFAPLASVINPNLGVKIAYAQVTNSQGQVGPWAPDAGTGTDVTYGPQNNTASGATTATSATTASSATPVNPDNRSGQFTCSTVDVLCGLVVLINFIFNSVTNLLAGLAGVILDWSLTYSIHESTYSNGDSNTFLVKGWDLVRDFSTLVFIFALLTIACILILTPAGADRAQINPSHTFARVIIMALLISFSFWMCRSIITVGNVFAGTLYDKISSNNNSVATYAQNQGAVNNILNGTPSQIFACPTNGTACAFPGVKSLSVGILGQINPQAVLLSPKSIQNGKDPGGILAGYTWDFYIAYLLTTFIACILNLIMLYIFVSMFIIFLGRTVGLFIAVILSPIAFVSVSVPFLQKLPYVGFDDWKSEFLGLVFLAPVYMIFIYLAISFLNLPALFTGGTSSPLAVAVYSMISALLAAFVLLRGKSISQSMAGHIGRALGGVIDTAGMLAVGAATGGTAMLARNTIGRAGAAVATSGALQRAATGGPSQTIQNAQNRLASGISKIGVGKYTLGKTNFGRSLSNSVRNSGVANIGASSAKGVQNFGKRLYTVNPMDMSFGGMTVRKGAMSLANKSGNQKLAQTLAKNYTASIRGQTVRGRAIDIAAIRNAKTGTTAAGAAAAGALAGIAGGGTAPTTPPPGATPTTPTTPPAAAPTPAPVTSTIAPAATPAARTFSLAGNTTVASTTPKPPLTPNQGTPVAPKPPTTTPVKPPEGTPTFGDHEVDEVMRAQLTESSKPTGDKNSTAPAGNKLPEVKPSGTPGKENENQGFTRPRNMFTNTSKIGAPEHAPSLGDEELDNVMRASVVGSPKSGVPKPTYQEMFDASMDHLPVSENRNSSISGTPKPLSTQTEPNSKPAAQASSFLENIQAPTQAVITPAPQNSGTIPAPVRVFGQTQPAPTYTPAQQERILNNAIAAQEKSVINQKASEKNFVINQESVIQGSNQAIRKINSTQETFERAHTTGSFPGNASPEKEPVIASKDSGHTTFGTDDLDEMMRASLTGTPKPTPEPSKTSYQEMFDTSMEHLPETGTQPTSTPSLVKKDGDEKPAENQKGSASA